MTIKPDCVSNVNCNGIAHHSPMNKSTVWKKVRDQEKSGSQFRKFGCFYWTRCCFKLLLFFSIFFLQFPILFDLIFIFPFRIWTYPLSGCICAGKTGSENSITWSTNTSTFLNNNKLNQNFARLLQCIWHLNDWIEKWRRRHKWNMLLIKQRQRVISWNVDFFLLLFKLEFPGLVFKSTSKMASRREATKSASYTKLEC